MNVPLLAITEAVKLDFFTGRDRDNRGVGWRGRGRGDGVVQHTTGRLYVKFTVSYVCNFPGCDNIYCANKGSRRKMVKESGQSKGRDKNTAAVILLRAQEIKVEGQIYDKMRDGDVKSSRRQEVCERAVASIRFRPRLPLSFHFIAFVPPGVDGWTDEKT